MEELLFETKPSTRRVTLSSGVYALVILIGRYTLPAHPMVTWGLFGLLLVVLARVLFEAVRTSFISYQATDQYLQLQEGIIARKTKRAPWLKITNFTCDQSMTGRMLGLADVRIDTPGHDQWELEFKELVSEDAAKMMALLQEYVPDAQGPSESRSARAEREPVGG